MKKLLFLIIILITITAIASTAFYEREFTSGALKTCVYDCMGSKVYFTVKSYQLCPLTIQAECL